MRMVFPGLSRDSEVFYPPVDFIYRENLYLMHSMGIYDCDAGYSVVRGPGGWPLDESCQLCLTLDGDAVLDYRDNRYHLLPGDLFLIDCRYPHAYRPGDTGKWQKLWTHFDGLNSRALAELVVNEHSPVMRIGIDSQVHGHLRVLFDELKATGTVKTPLASGRIHRILTDLLAWRDPLRPKVDDQPMTPVTAYIERNLGHPISIPFLAKLACMSEGHFIRRFKALIGQSPYEYVVSRRIDTAARLLTNTNLSVKAITLQTGFTNESRFIQAFKKRKGMTPQEFRLSQHLHD